MKHQSQLFERQFTIGKDTEARVRLLSHSQGTSLVIEIHREQEQAPVGAVSIPASLIPELRRSLEEIEQLAANDHDAIAAAADPEWRRRATTFANDSEAEFARILDFYRIRWEYEPTTFPIVWDEEGYVKESFTPDFYLPDYGLFIELTTMKQSLVTKKNRKVRLFREHYPELPIKLFYGKDYKALLAKFGIRPEAESTEGGDSPPAETPDSTGDENDAG